MTWHWSIHPHPEVWVVTAILLFGYLRIQKTLVARGIAPATTNQRRCWFAGVIVLTVGASWPIHDLAEGALYSVHMVQHLMFTMAAAPLFLMGAPAGMVRMVLRGRTLQVVRFFSRPMVALIGFNSILVITHWPLLVNTSIGNEWMHVGVHAVIMASALAMWMPVLSPVGEIPRLSLPGQSLYLFLQSLVPTIPASFLTFGTTPLYAAYVKLPKLFGLTALDDQRIAGLIMKIIGGAVLWGFIAVIFFRWSRIEQRDGVDLLDQNEIDRSQNRMELTR